MLRTLASVAAGVLVLAAVVTFAVGRRHATSIGGTTTNGKCEADRFYVGNHGVYTEVTREAWDEARAYERATSTSFLIVVVAAAPLGLYASTGRRPPPGTR